MLRPGHAVYDAQDVVAEPEPSLDPGQAANGAREAVAGVNLAGDVLPVKAGNLLPATNNGASPDRPTPRAEPSGGHRSRDAQATTAPETVNGQVEVVTQSVGAVDFPSLLLGICADALDDLEKARIAAENRHRSLVKVKGLGGAPEAARLEGIAKALSQLEHDAELELRRALRAHPLGPWVSRTVGVGEKQGARLIAAIGDPLRYVDSETGEVVERTVSKLWAYCGYDPKQKRVKGVKSNWNVTAKMRAYLVAQSCVLKDGKHGPRSPYRDVYDEAKKKYLAERDWTAGHAENAAKRVLAKEVIKDLWREARRLEAA